MEMMKYLLVLTFVVAYVGLGSSAVYEPAEGFFICPDTAVCKLSGCDATGCSIIPNGFAESNVGGQTVYTADISGTQADLSITVTSEDADNTQIECDSACTCQEIIAGRGCSVVTTADSDEPPETKLVQEVDQDTTNAEGDSEEEGATQKNTVDVLIDDSSGSNVTMMRLGSGAVCVVAILSFLLQ